MADLVFTLKSLGSTSLDVFWFPLGIWTVFCALTFLILRYWDTMNPLFHYHLRVAAVLSLPLGIGAAALLQKVPEWFSSSNIETAFFVVQNPIEIVVTANSSVSEATTMDWIDPSLWIGIVTLCLLAISLFMTGRLINSYLDLRSLYKTLSIVDLKDIRSLPQKAYQNVKVAFHDHPLVPFTFGWKQPVIVLPRVLQQQPDKFEMALQHELTHIKRGDYLLQLFLSMIESVFWFHPLIQYGSQEIDTYREISCDQEVLSKSEFSIKSYASLLYELVPLSGSAGRLSVSMAVQQSTLKKRIKTMKYYKLHKASFRQSIAFLLLMIVGITLPIACSDLRTPESLSMEELESSTLQLQGPQISINGLAIENIKGSDQVEVSGLGALVLNTTKGVFKIAPRNFEGSKRAGQVSGNTLSFSINEMDVTVSSSATIINNADESPLWIQHLPYEVQTNTITAIPDAFKQAPPPPPAPGTKSDDGDYFVVVEEMPKLIGGMQAIQSKIEYPEQARKAGIEGQVVVRFVVDENGDVIEPEVVRGISSGADAEALRVVKEAQFEPGMQRGKAVRVQYAMAINFKLQDSDFAAPNPPEKQQSK
ncbi:M56 family metallopeptidase [Gracilimonas mengyeensis]|uniref:TonB family C-terminal domain-containing protein n=1 Tax=Gracilimonas mengyeensis TaxID=1302730 RepID=A0A521DBT8_9BACT|nr:M56 family metallopeptidase [Gracilimonas mengyeensis]SMO69169.1 TonB family C-terminal domain-containing protein [Gracilimonas mengyeensis]